MCKGRSHKIWLFAACLTSGKLSAQTLSFDPRSAFDRAPIASARAAGMAEAVSPVANGPEAAYYQPAAIGGIQEKGDGPALSSFYFPFLAAAGDSHAVALARDLQAGKDLEDDAIASEMLRAFDGQNPYARVSVYPHLVYHRILFSYTYDVRASSTPNTTQENALDIDMRSQRGPVLGYSLASDRKDLYWGFTLGMLERSETRGTFPIATINEANDRRQAFHDVNKVYKGTAIHSGALWTSSKKWRPSLSVAVRNLTGTRYDSSDPNTPTYKDPEDLTIGASLSPSMGIWGYWNLIFEANELTRNDIEVAEKFRVASEMTFGEAFGSNSTLAFRFGYRYAGLSWGASLRLGVLGLHFASYPEDVGVGSSHVIERRSIVNLAINLAE